MDCGTHLVGSLGPHSQGRRWAVRSIQAISLSLFVVSSVCVLVLHEVLSKSSEKWAHELMESFDEGISVEYVYEELSQRTDGDRVQFYNECTKQHEYPVVLCDEGYRMLINVEMPGYERSLCEVGLQAYFTFDKDQRLVRSMHELNNSCHH